MTRDARAANRALVAPCRDDDHALFRGMIQRLTQRPFAFGEWSGEGEAQIEDFALPPRRT